LAFDINDIRAQLTFGGARGTQFLVQIQNPIDGSANLKTPFLTRASSLPPSTLGTIQVPFFGRFLKLAGDRNFQPWTVIVMNDEDFLIRNAMEAWSNKINALRRNIRDLPGSEAALYKSQAQIVQLSKTGKRIREYTFSGIWPAQISEIQTDWGAQDSIQEFAVTFEYDWHEVTGGTTGSGGGA
jgi:hypothetical protein